MAITRADLLKELMPGINKLFGEVYAEFNPHTIEEYEIQVDFDGTDPIQVAHDDGRI